MHGIFLSINLATVCNYILGLYTQNIPPHFKIQLNFYIIMSFKTLYYTPWPITREFHQMFLHQSSMRASSQIQNRNQTHGFRELLSQNQLPGSVNQKEG